MPLKALGFALVLLFAGVLLRPGAARAQFAPSPSPHPVSSADLMRAQLRETRAQAAYTEAQLQALQATPRLEPLLTLGATVVTALGVICGIAITARQLRLSITSTSETNLLQLKAQTLQQETQQDSEFFDIIKQFSDKDSALSRACGASLLGVVEARYRFIPPRLAVDYLAVGLELEPEVAVIDAIARTLKAVKARRPIDVSAALDGDLQRRIADGFIAALADFVAANAAAKTPIAQDAALDKAATIASRDRRALGVIANTPPFANALVAAPGRVPAQDALGKTQSALVVASSRSQAVARIQAP